MPTPDPSSLQFDVVIAGGGFAGIDCARALGRRLGTSAARRVALISDQNYTVFQPMLPEVAGSSLNPRHVVNPIRRHCPETTVLRATITGVDLDAKCLTVAPGEFSEARQIGFEHLVLALGSVVDLSRVPGMPEHALLMKNVADALRLRAAVIDRFEEASLQMDEAVQKRLLTFVIVGGGYSGVETAGQIFDLVKEMAASYRRLNPDGIRVVLIHSGPHLLPEISESLGRYAEENLRRRGMEILLGARVSSITASHVMLEDGTSLESHTVVSTVGNAPHPLLTELAKKHGLPSVKGRLVTDQFLRVQGQEKLWAAGDGAAVPMPRQGESAQQTSPFDQKELCPPTAQFATRQGALLAHNVAAVVDGDGALQPFTFTGLGELAVIGHHAAVAEILGWQFQGFIAWWMWRTIYLMKLPGLERKLRVVLDWTLDLFFPRDIADLQPRPTRLLNEMHLSPGDLVFRAGDPARRLYIVKAGRLELRDAEGKVLRALTAGHQLGRQTLAAKRPWPFTAVATEECIIVSVSARVFEAVTSAGATIDEVFAPVAPEENATAALP